MQDILHACVRELSLQYDPSLLVSSGRPLHTEVCNSVKCFDKTTFVLATVSGRAPFKEAK